MSIGTRPIELGPEGTAVPEPFSCERTERTWFSANYQDVAAFRRYLATAAQSLYGADDAYHRELTAAHYQMLEQNSAMKRN